MPLRLLRFCLCLVLFGCATTPSAPARAPASPEVPACTPGELLFAPSYLPLDLVPTPDGRSLLVVDRGFLALRDVSTRQALIPLHPPLLRPRACQIVPGCGIASRERGR